MSAPRFSVVIAAFNSEATIHSAVTSALSQTLEDLEVIVVDDGSEDPTADQVRAITDPRVKLIVTANGGTGAARNAGVAQARGRYVTILDSDDLLLPHFLERMDSALGSSSRPGFAYTDAYVFDAATGRVREQSAMQGERPLPALPDRERFLGELLSRNFIYVSATIPRDVFEAVGGYSTVLRGVEDYDLWLRITIAGYDPAWVPGLNALYRVHSAQLSRNTIRMREGTLSVFRGLSPEVLPSDEHREILAQRIAGLEREVQIVSGEDRPRYLVRQLRHRLGRAREGLGLSHTWYTTPPPEVAAAFPDLKGV